MSDAHFISARKQPPPLCRPGRLERTHYSKWAAVERRNTHFLNKASRIMVYRFFSNGPSCRTPQKPSSQLHYTIYLIFYQKKIQIIEVYFHFQNRVILIVIFSDNFAMLKTFIFGVILSEVTRGCEVEKSKNITIFPRS